jgi:type IV pilus assembly protein PilA
MKSKVSEANSISAPARLAVAQAFNEGTLTSTTDNTALNLPAATAITSKYVKSVTAAGNATAGVGTVTVEMQGFNDTTIDGKKIVYKLTCTAGSSCVTTIDSTSDVPTKYLPKV